MNTRTAAILSCAVTLICVAYAAYVYQSLPDTIVTHWDAAGKPNGHGSRGTVFMMPGISFVFTIFLFLLPWISPKNFKIESFRGTFNYIIFLLAVLMNYTGIVITQASLNPHSDPTKPLLGGILLFMGILGNLMGKVQRNFFVGIRTPWTLASDKVWVATHRLGARVMTASGILGAICIWCGLPAVPLFLVCMAAVFYPALYSLFLYKKLEKTHAL